MMPSIICTTPFPVEMSAFEMGPAPLMLMVPSYLFKNKKRNKQDNEKTNDLGASG